MNAAPIASGGDRGRLIDSKFGNRALLVVAGSAPLFVLAGLVTGAWVPLTLFAAVSAVLAWSLADPRVSILFGVLLASFVDYNTGMLTLQLAILCSWAAWTVLVIVWRSAWKGWVFPPRAMWPGLIAWLGVCMFGAIVGLARGNDLRNLGLELAAALWPFVGVGILQLYGRGSLAYGGLGLVAIGLIHTAFGLTMLQVHHQRLGGIYFTTLTGFVAVGLWTAAMLAPRRAIRLLCLAAMVPLLTHLFYSFTRGYWLGFFVGFLLATALSWRSLSRWEPFVRVRRLALFPAAALVLGVVLGLSALYFDRQGFLTAAGSRLGSSFSTELSPETLSNIIRLDEYDRAIGAALQSPVIGKGFGYSFITRDLLTRSIKDQWFVHNYYLWLWLKVGVVGLAGFGFLLWSFVRAARRTADTDGEWLVRVWAIAAIAVTGQLLTILVTNYSLADVTTASVFAFLWGAFWSIRPPREARADVGTRGPST